MLMPGNHALCCWAVETQIVSSMVFPHRSADVASDVSKMDSWDPEPFAPGDRLSQEHRRNRAECEGLWWWTPCEGCRQAASHYLCVWKGLGTPGSHLCCRGWVGTGWGLASGEQEHTAGLVPGLQCHPPCRLLFMRWKTALSGTG